MFVSVIYEVQDCNYCDIGDTDKTSKYTLSSSQYSYDSNNNCYLLKLTSNNTFGSAMVNNLSISDNVKITYDIQLLGSVTSNLQPAIMIGNLIARMIYHTKQITLCNQSYSDISNATYSSLSLNTWYTVELSISNGTATLNLKNNDTVLATCNGNVSSLISQSNDFKYLIGYVTNSNANVKNLKIKPL